MRREELETLLHPILEEAGYELVQCSVSGGAKTQNLRILIDREEGVTIDACAQVSRKLSLKLDANPMMRGAYAIEVSSAGMNRPIWTQRHFARFEGERVRLEFGGAPEGPQVLEGQIGPVEGDGFWLELGGGSKRLIQLKEVMSAQLRMDPWKKRPLRAS